MTVLRLSHGTLSPAPAGVALPAYDPRRVTSGIVHLGLGNFARAHLARYTHDLMNLRADALDWGITGVGLMPTDRDRIAGLMAQDGLYTLVERDGKGEQATIIGSLAAQVFAGDSTDATLTAIDRPGTRIVSLTVTEHGYCLDRATKRLDPDHPAIVHDRAHPARPTSAPGVIVEAYRRRRTAGRPAFSALSCDNIQGNGDVLRDAVLDLARLNDPGLAGWIAGEARFPNTMVDRITPASRPDDRAEVAARYAIGDAWPVFCEPFSQWVVEDQFAAGRPAWDEVGAQFVGDVAPYERMKLRLLNASHLAIAALGRLMGYMFGPNDCWCGFAMNRSGSSVHALQMAL